jgi:hypothetical protein
MLALKIGGLDLPPKHINKETQLNDKIFELAQELLINELFDDTLFACGEDFTNRTTGKYGMYETVEGEVVSFQPKKDLEFMLICDDFVIIDNLAMIRTVTHHIDDYELSVPN